MWRGIDMASVEDISVKVSLDTTELKKELEELNYLRFYYDHTFFFMDKDQQLEIEEEYKLFSNKDLPEGY